MGKELLPQDKEYIMELLDDVFFYIKNASNFCLTKENKFGRNDVT